MVEMKGVEPLSVKASPKASTSLLSFKVSHKNQKLTKSFSASFMLLNISQSFDILVVA